MMPIVTRPRLLALCLIAAVAGIARADPPSLPPLLKTLDLRGYPARTAAPAFSGNTLEGRQFT